MMNESFAQKLWNASPKRIVEAVRRRLTLAREAAAREPHWLKIQAGPLVGAEMLLAPAVSGSWQEIVEGRFDAFLFDALARDGSIEGKTVWDIGAHFGYHTLCFARLVGESGHVVAFEPNPWNAERLRQNLEGNPELAGRVQVESCALADRDGEAEFVLSDDVESGDSSCSYVTGSMPPLEAGIYARFRRQLVRMARVDALLEQERSPPSVIKIDVEGAELLVLRGGREFFTKYKPLLLIEVHHIQLMFHVCQFLRERGYQVSLFEQVDLGPSRCFVWAK